jgi:methyl-accepting chemotaxis protein
MIIIVFIITITGIFYNNIYLNILAGLFLAITILILIGTVRRGEKTSKDEELTCQEKINKSKELSAEELNNVKEKITAIKSKYEESISRTDNLHRLLTEFDLTAPIIEKLSAVIMKKSEESTLNATEKIFTIVGESQEVSKDIQTLLADMSQGDHSLEHEMDKLLTEVEDFKAIVVKVEQLKTSYERDMGLIENTVVNIKSLADSISDIADQTSILAINASIEAARAGKAGAGFAVIAGETHKLASDSKQITEKISAGIKEIGITITSSFKRQSETLNSTVDHLQEAKESFHQMTYDLAPQIKNIASSVQKSKDLSESVTARLNEITMSLQYQDATRQILEHIVLLVEEIQKKFISLDQEMGFKERDDRVSINTNILANASKFFTVREEWIALNLELNESQLKENDEKEDFQGDITLF